jgi:AAA15 family ATPase/GTPase
MTNGHMDIMGRNILSDYVISKYLSYSNMTRLGSVDSSISINDGEEKFQISHEKKGISGNGHLDEVIMKNLRVLAEDLAIKKHMSNENSDIEETRNEIIDRILSYEAMVMKGFLRGEPVNIKISYPGGLFKESSRNILVRDFIELTVDINYKKVKPNDLVFFSSLRNIRFGDLYDVSVERKRIGKILQRVKEHIDHFQDLRASKGKFRILSSESDTAIPLEVRGDGLKSFIYMMFMENILDDGTILIEEPENFLHPGLMGSWCNDVIGRGSGNQYFISTHSCELIEYMLENEVLRKDLKIFKMFKDPFDYEAITGEEAYERVVELKEDLRGI